MYLLFHKNVTFANTIISNPSAKGYFLATNMNIVIMIN